MGLYDALGEMVYGPYDAIDGFITLPNGGVVLKAGNYAYQNCEDHTLEWAISYIKWGLYKKNGQSVYGEHYFIGDFTKTPDGEVVLIATDLTHNGKRTKMFLEDGSEYKPNPKIYK